LGLVRGEDVVVAPEQPAALLHFLQALVDLERQVRVPAEGRDAQGVEVNLEVFQDEGVAAVDVAPWAQ